MPKTMPRTQARQPPGGLLQVPRAHDVVPIEHAARLVPGDRHRDPLRHPRVDEIPHRGPALWQVDRYEDFLEARRKLLAQRANEFLNL